MKNQLPPWDEVNAAFRYLNGMLLWRVGGNGRKVGLRAGSLGTDGYRVVRLHYVRYKEQRLIWLLLTGRPPQCLINHINGIRDDNRIENLREATWSDVGANSISRKRLRGTRRDRQHGKYRANITKGGKTHYLGWFDSEVEAARAYDKVALAMFGKFATLNFAKAQGGAI